MARDARLGEVPLPLVLLSLRTGRGGPLADALLYGSCAGSPVVCSAVHRLRCGERCCYCDGLPYMGRRLLTVVGCRGIWQMCCDCATSWRQDL